MNVIELVPRDVRVFWAKSLLLIVATYLVLRISGFYGLFMNDADGIAALLQIIGTLYSVLYAFATYVIWGQFTAVENENPEGIRRPQGIAGLQPAAPR